MSFLIYDLVLLAIFAIFTSSFLYRNKNNLKKEGLLLLYKAGWGIKLIDYVGKKYKKTLDFLSYIIITIGYLLMAGVLWLFVKLIWIYVFHPSVVRAIKIPPIMPLIPYLPQMFELNFLPPFYFIYWILILAVIAITHEFAHGIFMRRYDIKIKSTGFGFFPFFLPVFLAAFVEQDEKSMVKASRFKQMTVLAAGTFANVVTGVLFFLIIWIFFSVAFTPAGVQFSDYTSTVVDIAAITMMNNVSIKNPDYEKVISLAQNSTYNYVETDEGKYIGIRGFSEDQLRIALYDNAPAIKSQLRGAITHINDIKIESVEKLGKELEKYFVGEEVTIRTVLPEENLEFKIILEEHPEIEGKGWLGVGFISVNKDGLLNTIIAELSSFRDSNVYYLPKIGDFGWFIYDLLWWMILISFSVAFVNMLPVGIFDGGRFFYLTLLSITKNEKFAQRTFAAVTYLFLFAVLFIMFFWAIGIF